MSNPAQGAVGAGQSYQERVRQHFLYVAGDDTTDMPERRDRACEEFAELQQALGGTLEGWIAVGRYVWGRPIGEPAQEMGGTLNTLAALAAWADLDMMACAEAELERTKRPEIVAKIRRKRANRHGRGVLPGNDADLVTAALASPRADSDDLTAGEDVPLEAVRGILEASATPAQPAGAVPDSLRALSEAASQGDWSIWREPILSAEEAVRELTLQVEQTSPLASHLYLLNASGKCPATTGCGPTSQANANFIVAAVNFVRSLLSTHPAGQSAGSGAETSEDEAEIDRILAMSGDELRAELVAEGHDPDALVRQMKQGLDGTLRLAADRQRCREEATSWRRAAERLQERVNALEVGLKPFAAVLADGEPVGPIPRGHLDSRITRNDLRLATKLLADAPAPDSTRTGDEGAATVAAAILPLREDLREAVSKALHDNQFADGWPEMVDPVVDAVLAARPAAPEAQGAWSFDMEAAPRDGSDVEIVNDRGQFIAQFDRSWGRSYADAGWWMVSDGKDPERPLRGDEPFAWRIPTKAPAPPASSGQEG